MVSAQPQERPSPSSDARTVFRNELTACLALTAPVGMTEEAKRDWLAVAWDSLKHLPPDILQRGARAARLKCDHPSKIVPAIIEETRDALHWRREATSVPRLTQEPKRICTGKEASEILREIGIKPGFNNA